MNIIKEGLGIDFISESNFIYYSMRCPACIYESMYHRKTYPKVITCPLCDTEYEIEYKKDK